MKKVALILATAVVFGTGISTQQAIAMPEMDKRVVGAEYIVVAATVESVDYERRTITLKGPDSKSVTLRASKEVRKLSEIKNGDLVTAEYLDAVAVIVRKPDGTSNPGYLKEVSVAPRGSDSDGFPVDTIMVLGTVEAIDHVQRTVTIKTSDGVIKSYKVDHRVKKFRDILKGDKVSLRLTEPLAVRIRPVEK
jgi:translation initiation factor IF-1